MRNPFKGRIRKSFLERNQIIIGIICALVVVGGSILALLLSSGFFADTFTVTARFADAAGLKGGDEVLVAGLEAGTVDDVTVKDGAVEVVLKVNSDIVMPKDTRAEIIVETLMGKKSVALHGSSDDSGRLEDGDEIPLESTRTPVELLDLQDTSVPLLEKSDADAFEAFMVSISEITSGQEVEIRQLLSGFAQTTKAIDLRSRELARLIDSFRILSTAFADKDDDVVSLIDRFDVVLSNLAARTEDLERLLQATDSASHEIADLVSRNRSDLDSTLRNLHTTLDTINQHQIDLAGTVSYLHDAVLGYQSIGYSQGTKNRWANIFVQSLGPVGVDPFFGPCGAFDKALDKLLGEDPRPCRERAEYGAPKDEGGNGGGGGNKQKSGNGTGGPGSPDERDEDSPGDLIPDEPGLPGDVGGILDSVTGEGTSDDLREGRE